MDNKMASFGGRREFQRKSHWKFFLFLIFLTAFLVSGGLLLRNLYRSQQEQVRVYQAQRRAPGKPVEFCEFTVEYASGHRGQSIGESGIGIAFHKGSSF